MAAQSDDAELYEQELLAIYRGAYLESGLTYEQLAAASGLSRPKLVRLIGPNPDGTADLDPAEHFRLSRALSVDLADAVGRAEQRVAHQHARAGAEVD